jgi:hypothetical protein
MLKLEELQNRKLETDDCSQRTIDRMAGRSSRVHKTSPSKRQKMGQEAGWRLSRRKGGCSFGRYSVQ